mmetsp:Transcript_40033/g.60609  ORF Transcript_40033/g.60609 Transcript_40033/m.60609 type:complete len:87 (-) Transcript_40033:39-299(-)
MERNKNDETAVDYLWPTTKLRRKFFSRQRTTFFVILKEKQSLFLCILCPNAIIYWVLWVHTTLMLWLKQYQVEYITCNGGNKHLCC